MILTYHKIHPENKTIWWVTPDRFYRQMADLRSKKVVYLDDYDPANPTQAVITFDGVYKEIWKYAVPILQHFGYPFELFVIGQTIGKDNSFDVGEPCAEFADVETLQKMVNAGGRLQWHSWSHARLAGTTDLAVYEKELSVPGELRQLCPQGFKWYAYPHGERDVVYRAQVESRFTGALACDDGNDADRYDLNRLTVYEDTRLSGSTVSLIIPCYNYGHLAAEAIESALLQTYPPDEILFIDDASSDNSLEVARRYQPRIRVEANQKNLGVVENFRKAVEMTSGDYIVFLGADNRFRSDYVEQCKAILDAHPDVGIVYTHFALFGPRAGVQAAHTGGVAHPVAPGVYIKEFPENPSISIREKNYIHGSSMYRRVAYQQAGGYRREYLPEDNSLFARMLENGWKARLWNAPSLEYRHHSKEQLDHLKSFEMENVHLRREKTRLENVINGLENAVYNLEQKVAERETLLQQIQQSTKWKTIARLEALADRFLPPGSKRRTWAKRFLIEWVLPLYSKREKLRQQQIRLIQKSKFFNQEWYLQKYPDVAQDGMNPARHYLLYGGQQGRDPGPEFSSQWYLNQNDDVKRAQINPLLHYLVYGKKENRDPTAQSSQIQNSQEKTSIPSTSSWLPFNNNNSIGQLLKKHGGVCGVFSKIKLIQRQKGVWELLKRIGRVLKYQSFFGDIKLEQNVRDAEYAITKKFRIVPFYLNPYQGASQLNPTPSLAVHLHLFYGDMLALCISYLQNIPVPFSLYVSVPETANLSEIDAQLRAGLPTLEQLTVKAVPNRGRDIAPFIVEFGPELLKHDVIAHIHTKKSPHNTNLNDWFQEIMETIFSSPAAIAQILLLFQKDAKFIYPASFQKVFRSSYGWGDNFSIAKGFAQRHWKTNLRKYPLAEFPEGSMFWASAAALRKFLQLPLRYADFPPEPLPVDGTLAHALERLLLISANDLPGRNYSIHTPRHTIREGAYEKQGNYSETLVHPSVKILSYYLPQFYPTPENDLWHGKGFTEWHKVKSTNPLFYGHYQQRSPHEDAGYYTLTNTEILKKQSRWMKQAGVHGQVFYHYWFSGKLILEKPAQMLLADPSIEIPFCFCWANENWTRKWDGNESEILLQQNYSAEDAADFIKYLIPFFKDSRYIKIDGRPVIFIYRPSSIPDFSLYQRIWQETCARENIAAPYVVAVLTRGATSPHDFGMDAGCERVLHDWTAGGVKDIRKTLHPYWDIRGSVLDYEDVADYYMSQKPHSDFTYFRSIIPSWDNTPRYASEAYIIHNSSPKKFQEWLEHLIQDAEQRLEANQRFVLINAWNEWAESAILDPDSRYGYAYLNAIGRALSGKPYEEREYTRQALAPTLKVSIFVDESVLEILRNNLQQKRKFFTCLANSSVFELCQVTSEQSEVIQGLQSIRPAIRILQEAAHQAQYTLHFQNNLYYFAPDAVENMLKMALRYDVGTVLPTILNDENVSYDENRDHWETARAGTSSTFMLINNGSKRSAKYCVDARAYKTEIEAERPAWPVVSTILRFHQSGDLELLQNALYSLVAQNECIVQPILTLQSVSGIALEKLQRLLDAMPWHPQYPPVLLHYQPTESQKDLRATMLNEGLKAAQNQYAAFLDYDDILFPGAYAWLIQRLQKTGKNAAFGTIYTTIINHNKSIVRRYLVYDYGKTYKDFLLANHTPIHGFMLDLSKIDLARIQCDPGMKYMEDYYLTLQIFTEKETDWESIRHKKVIGDYCHYQDKEQTLAILGESRGDVVRSPEYIACEEQLNALRHELQAKQT